jgi:hypothetical protein
MWIAIPVVLLTVLIIGPLIIAFGGFTVEDTMPSEEDYNYADDEVKS